MHIAKPTSGIDVKTYRARTLQGALLRVRDELGPDASVLETREVWDGVFGQRQFEVLASDEVVVPSRFDGVAESNESYTCDLEAIETDESPEPRELIAPAHCEDQRSRLRCGLRESSEGWISSLEEVRVEEVSVEESETCSHLEPLLAKLIDANMDAATANELVSAVAGDDAGEEVEIVEQRLLDSLESQLGIAGPIQATSDNQHVVALVGPTGMGKTTTVAKLAAHFKLVQHLRVGLITVDTYRVAAVDQLRTYADIMELPLVVAYAPDDVQNAIAELSDCDLILIDTAGCSPQDEPRLEGLERTLTAAAADEIHLVAGATLSRPAMQLTTERFTKAGAQAMILTKLDEASGLGDLLRINRESGLPFSYLCEGQEVPHDIRAAVASELARRIFGQDEES